MAGRTAEEMQEIGKKTRFSGSLAAENGKKGGKAKAENMRKNKTRRETLETLLSLPIKDENTKAFILEMGFSESDLNNGTVMDVAMYQQAVKGDVKAYELIRDTIGEKPADKLAIEEPPQIILKRPDK